MGMEHLAFLPLTMNAPGADRLPAPSEGHGARRYDSCKRHLKKDEKGSDIRVLFGCSWGGYD